MSSFAIHQRRVGRNDLPKKIIERPKVFRHGEGLDQLVGRFLVKGLLPITGSALLAGQSQAGKTFLGLDLAQSIALGTPWFGRKVTARGGTLFLLAEGQDTMFRRLEAIRLGKAIPYLSQHPIEGTYADGLPIMWRDVENLSDPEVAADVIEHIKEIRRDMLEEYGVLLRMIVVDTLAAAYCFENENDAAEATRAMKLLQKMSAEAAEGTDVLALGIAHHGKDNATGVRGSSALTASADAILAAVADKDEMGRVSRRTVRLAKSRDEGTGWNAEFSLQPIEIARDEDDQPVTSPIILYGEEDVALKPRTGKTSKGNLALQTFKESFDILWDNEKGEYRKPSESGQPVPAISVDLLKREFIRRYHVDKEDEKPGKKLYDLKRNQWKAGLKAARVSRQFIVLEDMVLRVWEE